jgi:hypothetical protein
MIRTVPLGFKPSATLLFDERFSPRFIWYRNAIIMK